MFVNLVGLPVTPFGEDIQIAVFESTDVWPEVAVNMFPMNFLALKVCY